MPQIWHAVHASLNVIMPVDGAILKKAWLLVGECSASFDSSIVAIATLMRMNREHAQSNARCISLIEWLSRLRHVLDDYLPI